MPNLFTHQRMDSLDNRFNEPDSNVLGDITLFTGKVLFNTLKYSIMLTGVTLYGISKITAALGKFVFEKPKHALAIGALTATGYFGYNHFKDDKPVKNNITSERPQSFNEDAELRRVFERGYKKF